jgi:hypothetical protein
VVLTRQALQPFCIAPPDIVFLYLSSMKFIIPIFSAAVFLFTSCNNRSGKDQKNEAAEQNTSAVSEKLPANFYKKMKGKIGDDIYITVDLIKRTDSLERTTSLSGYYYYDKIGMPLDLYGDISDSGTFKLDEMDAKGETTGNFEGKFINTNTVKGTWTNPKTKKQYSFELSAVETDTKFIFSEYYNENCRIREVNMQSNKKDTLNWLDTMCSSVHVSMVSLANTAGAGKKMNDMILKSLLSLSGGEKPHGSIGQLIHEIDNYGPGDIMDAEYSTGIVSYEKNILSMSVYTWQNTGGAHPNGYGFFLNFDTRTGDTLSLLDVLKPETADELVYRGKEQFIKENGNIKENGWFWDEGNFFLPQTFAITKGGLLFTYQSYEAGPYAMGAPQFFLSWSQIKDIVKPGYLK